MVHVMEFSMKSNIGFFELILTLYMSLTIRLSYYLHRYSDPTIRKWICTTIGVINAAVILNVDMWHFFLAIIVSIWIITLVGPKYCHIAGFIATFSYLVIFRMRMYWQGIIAGQILTLVQSLAVMMVTGVAFEIHMAYEKKANSLKTDTVDPTEDDILQLGFLDIFHYVFNFATISTGPYVRYQVYSDFIKLPFSRALRRNRISALQITIISPICLLMYAIITDFYPTHFVLTDDFADKSFIYRINYCVLQWLRYRLFLYSGFGLIRSHSGQAGIGAYPVENKAISAHGPTQNNNNLRKITYEEAKLMDLEMDTTKSIEDCNFETVPTITEATRDWNMCIQYWLGVYIYKSLPKKFCRGGRVFLTLVVSWLWHSVYPSMLLACLFCAYYYVVESFYISLQKCFTGKIRTFMNIAFWISRQYYWGWAMMTYLLLDMEKVLIYYRSIYFAPLLFAITMHLLYVLVFSKIVNKKVK